jgi:DNA-binding transcriptional LysR family regulator
LRSAGLSWLHRDTARALQGPRAAGALRPLDVDTALLRTFQALAATRSFQKLVVRSRRQLRLTTAGEVLLGHVREALAAFDHAMATLQLPATSGEVRFGSPEDFATFFLPDILARFMEEHPTVRLRTHCALTLEVLEGLEAGNFDLVVIKQAPGRVHPSAIPLWRARLVWVAAEERPRTPFEPYRVLRRPRSLEGWGP